MSDRSSGVWTIGKRLLLRDIVLNLVPTCLLIYLFFKRTEKLFLKGGLINATFGLIGIFTLVKFILLSLHSIYIRKIRRPKFNLSRKKHSGKWAIITGASSTVGKAFAFKFASKGLNVCLVGRNGRRLHDIANHIKSSKRFPRTVSVEILEIDFATGNIDDFHSKLEETLAKMIAQYKATGSGGIGFLVNCMNYRNEIPSLHHEIDVNDVDRMIKTNVEGTLELVDAVLPYLIQQGPNYGSAVIMVGSHSSHHPTPMMSLYSATNAYRTELGKCHFEQYKDYAIEFLSVTPELMSSNMPRKTRNAEFVKSISAEMIVNASLRNLGYQAEYFSFLGNAQSTIIPHIMWIHPWHRFLNKMKIARLEMLRSRQLQQS